MEMRAGGAPGPADMAEQLALPHLPSDSDGDVPEMQEAGADAEAVIDDSDL